MRSFDLLWSRWAEAGRLASKTGAPITVDPAIVAGRYRLEERIGSGQFGCVYRAVDCRLQRSVAVKTVAPAATAEAINLAKLNHRNVVTLYDHGVVDGCGYLVMELVRGTSLAEWRRSTPRSRSQIIGAFLDAGRGLAAAHREGLVHRDFKPDNVLVADDGRVVVLDFGIAASTGREAGDGVGTLGYMAPEQIAGGRLTPASDQFAFCVALWEALVGSSPFSGSTVTARLESQIAGPREPWPPGRLGRVLLRGLARSPADRYPTMGSLLAELARAERQRHRRPLTAAATVAVVVLSSWGVLYSSSSIEAADDGPVITDKDLSVRSLTILAIAAAQDGRAEDSLQLLDAAWWKAETARERRIVADAADECGLALYEKREYTAAVKAHGTAWELYRDLGRENLAKRSLELARTAQDAR